MIWTPAENYYAGILVMRFFSSVHYFFLSRLYSILYEYMTIAGSPFDDANIYIIYTCTWIGCTQSLIIATILVRENRITQITTDVLINCIITTHPAIIRRYSSMYLYCRYMWVKLFVVKDTDNIASQFHCLTQPVTIHMTTSNHSTRQVPIYNNSVCVECELKIAGLSSSPYGCILSRGN